MTFTPAFVKSVRRQGGRPAPRKYRLTVNAVDAREARALEGACRSAPRPR